MARALVRHALAPGGFSILEAVNGQDALEQLTDEIACILCDVNMPRMNGYEFLSAARDSGLSLPPVLMVTAHDDCSPSGQEAGEMGVVGWIVKPFDRKILLNTVEGLVYGPHCDRTRRDVDSGQRPSIGRPSRYRSRAS